MASPVGTPSGSSLLKSQLPKRICRQWWTLRCRRERYRTVNLRGGPGCASRSIWMVSPRRSASWGRRTARSWHPSPSPRSGFLQCRPRTLSWGRRWWSSATGCSLSMTSSTAWKQNIASVVAPWSLMTSSIRGTSCAWTSRSWLQPRTCFSTER